LSGPDTPRTVGAYVRAKLPHYARQYSLWAVIGGGASAARIAHQFGFRWNMIPLAMIGMALGAALLIGVSAIALTVGGWWETRRYRD
ncbi:hypothetical protein SB781_34070, partial [Paraburkholderia sp. SIMBA_061]